MIFKSDPEISISNICSEMLFNNLQILSCDILKINERNKES